MDPDNHRLSLLSSFGGKLTEENVSSGWNVQEDGKEDGCQQNLSTDRLKFSDCGRLYDIYILYYIIYIYICNANCWSSLRFLRLGKAQEFSPLSNFIFFLFHEPFAFRKIQFFFPCWWLPNLFRVFWACLFEFSWEFPFFQLSFAELFSLSLSLFRFTL